MTYLTCWGETRKLVCDDITADVRVDADGGGEIEYNGTGLWMFNISESDDGFGGRYDGGRRLWSNPVCTRGGGDCDDQCSARCPGQSEGCDGIDNDCSDTVPGSDNDGIPDSLDPDARIFGSISPAEIDIDSDGFLSCDDFATNRTETQFTDFSCGESYEEEADVNDCSNLCFFSAPGGEERCDGFLGVCEGEYLDGTDEDRDDHTTCGAWSTPDGKVLQEDVYVVVWLKNIDWSQLGSEEVELLRPAQPNLSDSANPVGIVDPYDNVTPEERAYRRFEEVDMLLGMTSSIEDSGIEDSGYVQDSQANDIGEIEIERTPIIDFGEGLLGGDVSISNLDDVIPLVLPRDNAPDCDLRLQSQLTKLLGTSRMESILSGDNDVDVQDLMLQACEHEDSAGCAIVRIFSRRAG